MRFTTGRSAPAECPTSCSYSTNINRRWKSARSHHLGSRSRRQTRQPSGSGFSVCASQEAARETKKQAKAERPSEIAGRPVADSAPYDMPVPMDYEQTLQKAFTVAGIGLHSGDFATVRVRPAYAGEGRYFVRVPEGTIDPDNATRLERDIDQAEAEALQRTEEQEEQLTKAFLDFLGAQDEGYQGSFEEYYWDRFGELSPTVPIRAGWAATEEDSRVVRRGENEETVTAGLDEAVSGQTHLTSLSSTSMHVHTVEALLSALECCGVDNARIEIEGGKEIPTLDGSAMGWAINIVVAGVHAAPSSDDSQPQKMRQLKPPQMVTVSRGDAFITFYPSDTLKISCGVDHAAEAPIIGRQWFSWAPFQDDHYRWVIAPAKAFYKSMKHVYEMRARGLLKGGTVGVALIAYGWGWYEPNSLHFEDSEPARRRIIDLTGDLALLATPGTRGLPIGHITSHNADHALNMEFARALRESCTEEDSVDAVPQLIAEDVAGKQRGQAPEQQEDDS